MDVRQLRYLTRKQYHKKRSKNILEDAEVAMNPPLEEVNLTGQYYQDVFGLKYVRRRVAPYEKEMAARCLIWC